MGWNHMVKLLDDMSYTVVNKRLDRERRASTRNARKIAIFPGFRAFSWVFVFQCLLTA
jgi:hypothetical protein